MSEQMPRTLSRRDISEYETLEYMSRMNGNIHPALGSDVVYDGKSRKWRPNNPAELDLASCYAEALSEKDKLLAIVNKYLAKKKRPLLDLSTYDDWKTVRQGLDQTCAALEKTASQDNDASGLSARLKRGFYGLCENAGTGRLFTAFIPNDLMLTTPLCAGLNIVFDALEQTGIYRHAVSNAIERLPVILDSSECYLEIYDQHEKLHRMAAKLYAEVCLTLGEILRWFMKNAFVVGATQILQSSKRSEALSERMSRVQLAADDFKDRTCFLMQERLLSNLQDGFMGKEQAEELRDQLDRIGRRLERQNVLQDTHIKIFENIQSFLQQGMQRLVAKNTTTIAIAAPASREPVSETTSDEVLEELLYNPNLIPAEVEQLLFMGQPTSPTRLDSNRVFAIRSNSRVKAWLTLDESSLLLLNGGADRSCGATSFVSVRIVHHLRQQTGKSRKSIRTAVVAFFCNQHPDYLRDEMGDPSELAMSLLRQLIDQFREFSSNDLQKCLDKTDPEDISSICTSFRRLLKRLPSDLMLFLVVDGLDSFSIPSERRDKTREVMRRLVRIYHEQPRATLKFLFVSSTRRAFSEEFFEDDEVLNLPPVVPHMGSDPRLEGVAKWEA